MKKLNLIMFFLLLASGFFAQVQMERDVTASGGAEVSAGDLSLCWTMGELATETYSTSGQTVCLGFQQSKPLVIAVSDPEAPFELLVFPNPTAGSVFLSADINDDFTMELFDASGKRLLEQTIYVSLSPQEIPLLTLPSGIYFMNLRNNRYSTFSFKIQKTK